MAVVNNNLYSLYYAAAGDIQTGRLMVQGFVWSGATAKTDTLTFKDSAGDIVWGPILAGGVTVAGDTTVPIVVMFPKPRMVQGLEVDVLGSGTVTVFLAQGD